MGAFAVLFPMLPGFVKMVLDITAAIRSDPNTTPAQLAQLSAELKQVAADVAAAELPSGN